MRTHRKRLVVTTVLLIVLVVLLASLSGCKKEEPIDAERSGGAEDPVVEDVNK